MKQTLYILLLATLAFSCKKFSYYQINPNVPTQADPSLELTNVEQSAFSTISPSAALASRYLVYSESADPDQYYGWQRSDFSPYASIQQVVKMQQEAIRVNNLNYYYIGKFLTDYYIVGLTLTYGDVPFSKAMQAMNGDVSASATAPAYDKQHDIYLQVLNDLDIANDSLSATNGTIQGDVVYGGDITQWKKAINAFALRVLISLSGKTGDATLQVTQRFSNIVSNPAQYPLFISNDDNAALPYYNLSGNYYPYYNNNGMKTDYYLDSSFVHLLKGFSDPRLFVFGNPTTASGLPAGEFDAYAGLQGSASLSINVAAIAGGKASAINNRYAYDPINEPSVMIGYAEQEFTLAEAAARGWITGDVNTYYTNGVQAALKFSSYKGTYSDADITTYLQQPAIQLTAANQLSQILTQKYLSMFMNTGWEPFYNQRRTGIPVFETSGTGILNNGMIPKRWMYPTSEYQTNAANVNAAVSAQYPQGDDINGVMWLLQ
ncbi:MAG TPA: SusD/RagB family nutrient-binding outer membrane lipoprotein [Dinghuibacter sp.]|uniref:SusD/RagB family nutrient-binding outer membrane lipoprotein n=1 Tax=Dinghuibacter sp. TaxID=2024697 RepID=UPI002C6A1928|nr:SusD/RagB family nutrient-binding outer membrane lipoprotein [Dinghuibacter sp.]HTJ12354.1 SusD/RagB family nutrient-binding outer membrane lipoprotein [Dinghuibacter sp.]